MSAPRDVCILHETFEQDVREMKSILQRIEARLTELATLSLRVSFLEKVVYGLSGAALLSLLGALLALVLY